MDFRKINNQIIPLLLVITVSIVVAMVGRFIILQKGVDVASEIRSDKTFTDI